MQRPNGGGAGGVVPAKRGWRQVKGGGASKEQVERMRSNREHVALQRMNEQQGQADLTEEYDIVDTSRNRLGANFRFWFGIVMLAAIVVMGIIKLDGEFIEPPARDDGEMEEVTKMAEDATTEYFSMINQDRDLKTAEELRKENKKERAIRKKAEMKAAQEARDRAVAEMNSPECDKDCRAKNMQIDVLHNQVSATVVTDYYEVLEVKPGLGLRKSELREQFETVKAKVEANDPEVEHLDLAEVKEAFGVLMNNEARLYYNMYGQRPPESMRANAAIARDGGWGIQFQTHAWKVKKLKAWMEYFDSAEVDIGVLVAIGGFTLLQLAFTFRHMIQSMKQAFPDFDPEYAAQHEARMAQLRQQSVSRRKK